MRDFALFAINPPSRPCSPCLPNPSFQNWQTSSSHKGILAVSCSRVRSNALVKKSGFGDHAWREKAISRSEALRDRQIP